MGNTRHCQYQPLLLCLILSILVDTFLQGYQCLSSIQGFIISLPLDHRREPLIGRAYSPVVPITDEISPDEGFQFLYCHSFCVMPPIDEFFLHPGPHALATGIVMAASAGAVHALECHILLLPCGRSHWCVQIHGQNG